MKKTLLTLFALPLLVCSCKGDVRGNPDIAWSKLPASQHGENRYEIVVFMDGRSEEDLRKEAERKAVDICEGNACNFFSIEKIEVVERLDQRGLRYDQYQPSGNLYNQKIRKELPDNFAIQPSKTKGKMVPALQVTIRSYKDEPKNQKGVHSVETIRGN